MRLGCLITLVPVPIEEPELVGILPEELGVGGIRKGHPCLLKVRVGLPQTLIPPEVWEPRINSNTCTSRDKQGLTVTEDGSCQTIEW